MVRSPKAPLVSGFERHGLLLPSAAKIFEDLAIGGSLLIAPEWRPIHGRPELIRFEIEAGVMSDRYRYNDGCVARARKTRRSVLGHHRGTSDWFVPVQSGDRIHAILIVGPFGTNASTGAEIQERWRLMTGRQGHLGDLHFSSFVAASLAMTVFEGEAVEELRQLLERMALLMVGDGDALRLEREMLVLRRKLFAARFADLVWEAARLMVDERTTRMWSSSALRDQRPDLGIRDFPEHAAVGLLVSLNEEGDPIDDWVRRHGFQRACVELAAKCGNTLSGKIGEHGMTFLSASRGSADRSRRSLAELCERASVMARKRFGLRVHFGLSALPLPLPEQLQAAFAAAEGALSAGTGSMHAKRAARPGNPVGPLREELVRLIVAEPEVVPGRFDRFLEVVAARTAHRAELARVHLEVTFERLTQALQQVGGIENKSLELLQSVLERRAREDGTLNELFAVYRRAVSDLVQAVQNPTDARHERSFRRAEQFLREHYAETVSLAQVARVAGFAPSYFSVLFRRQHGVTFERYLMQLRLERAKELLSDTHLKLQRIAQLSGFSQATYLSRVFKRMTSETPMDYRWRALHEPRGGKRTARPRPNGSPL